MEYFVIHNSDGDTYVSRYPTKESLLDALSEHLEYETQPKYLAALPKEDTNYWGESAYLIIRGEIVTPKEKLVVKELDI